MGVDFGAGFDGAEPVRARRQRHRERLGRVRGHFRLEAHMRCRALTEQAQLAFRQWPQPSLGMKSQFDIAGEVALVVDVARAAMRAVRQFVQLPHIRLGAAAPRAEQVPAHHQDAEPLRGEEQFDRLLAVRAPGTRHRQWADRAQRHHRRMEQKVGELVRKPVACRIALERVRQGSSRRRAAGSPPAPRSSPECGDALRPPRSASRPHASRLSPSRSICPDCLASQPRMPTSSMSDE